jgi:hypothetical protein
MKYSPLDSVQEQPGSGFAGNQVRQLAAGHVRLVTRDGVRHVRLLELRDLVV